MRFYLIIGTFLAYSVFKATQLWPSHPIVASGIAAALFAFVLSVLFSFRAKPSIFEKKWFSAFVWTGYIAMGFIGTFILLSLPVDLVHLVITRQFLSHGLALLVFSLAAMFALIGLYQARRGPRATEVSIAIANLKAELSDLRIAQISDLHVGPTIRKGYVQGVVDRTNETNPDFIFVTGDLVDGPTASLAEHLEPLRSLKARFGVFYVTGNHEYYWQPVSLLQKIREFGFQVLINENRIVKVGDAKVLIAGVTDIAGAHVLDGHAPNFAQSIQTNEPTDLKIILAHRPDRFEEYELAGMDIQFSGHTHAGQFFPFNLLMPLAHTYYKGLNRFGRMWIYVNQGSGYWGPVNRFFIPTEITLATLSTKSLSN